jgi:hypothetical protein
MFQLSNLDTFTSFIAGVKCYNRVGDEDSTPLAGRVALASDGGMILFHSPTAINYVRSGYNYARWDDFADDVWRLSLQARPAKRPEIKAPAFVGLRSSISIGQLVTGEITFDPRQLPDSVLAGFGVKIAAKAKDEQGDVRGWVAEQLRLSEAHRAFAAQVQAQRQAGGDIAIQELPIGGAYGSVRVLGAGNDRRLTLPGLKVAIPAYTGR